jgi:hypothetical protein
MKKYSADEDLEILADSHIFSTPEYKGVFFWSGVCIYVCVDARM